MLHADHIHIRDVQKVRRAEVGRDVLLGNLEAHLGRVIVAAISIIDRHHQTLHLWKLGRHGAAQVRGEGGNSAFPWQVIAEKSDFTDVRGGPHESFLVAQAILPMPTIPTMGHAASFTKNLFQLRLPEAYLNLSDAVSETSISRRIGGAGRARNLDALVRGARLHPATGRSQASRSKRGT